MGTILIKNVTLKGEKKDILIQGNLIAKISDHIDNQADTIISGEGKRVMPGLINMHTHSAMTLMRGFQEDLPLFEWLQRVWEVEAHLKPEMIYWGTKLACLEMIKCGVLCFNDMYWQIEHAAKAVEEMGIRAFHSYVLLDGGDKKKQRLQREECAQAFEKSRQWNPLNNFTVALHAAYTVSEENMLWASTFAADHNLLLHTHISETQLENLDSMRQYGISPVKRMKRLGLLNDNVIAAHCVWVDEEDIKILGEKRVNVVHNINSNLKLASGYKFKALELSRAGANVTIGTDGAASSNNLDVLESIKTTAITQKAWRKDPSAMTLTQLLDMGTINAAKALRLNSGEIAEGKLADLILIDTQSPAFVPDFNFEANLLYSANSSCIETAICNGKVVMQERKVDGENEILENANRVAHKLIRN